MTANWGLVFDDGDDWLIFITQGQLEAKSAKDKVLAYSSRNARA